MVVLDKKISRSSSIRWWCFLVLFLTQGSGSGCVGLLGVWTQMWPGAWEGGSLASAPCGLSSCFRSYWRGDHGCSGETGTVVVNLGAVDVKQMLCVEQRRLRRFFLFLILSACRFLALSKLPSSQCIPIPLLVALIKVCFPSKFGSWDKRTEKGEGRGREGIEGIQPS